MSSNNRQRIAGLSKKEVIELLNWMQNCIELGYPRSCKDVAVFIKQTVEELPRIQMFKDGKPSPNWFKRFVKVHPKLRKVDVISRSNDVVSLSDLLLCHEYNTRYLEEKNLISILTHDPSRVFNASESIFDYIPDLVIEPKSEIKREYQAVLLVCGADGTFLEPFVLYENDGNSNN